MPLHEARQNIGNHLMALCQRRGDEAAPDRLYCGPEYSLRVVVLRSYARPAQRVGMSIVEIPQEINGGIDLL
jgi:hypothetical protein